MTPLARQELRRYCRDAARAKARASATTFADLSDMAVAIVCTAGLLIGSGYWWADQVWRTRQLECPTTLPDGRALVVRHLSERGDTRCIYETRNGGKR